MKAFLLATSCLFGLASVSSAALLFSDNFDAPDSASFDASPTTGRLSGTLASDVVLRSWGTQQQISNGQALFPVRGTNGLRFENNDGSFGADNRFNWAGGATGSSILAAGGFIVSFDWYAPGNDNNDWISFQVGTINADNGNLTNDDYGILFRRNGATERFDNTVNLGAGGSFTALPAGELRRVDISFEFSSFDDGSNVTATSFVNGTQVANDVFTWDDNGGEMRMELGNLDTNNRIDNLSVSTIPEPSAGMLASLALAGLALIRRRR